MWHSIHRRKPPFPSLTQKREKQTEKIKQVSFQDCCTQSGASEGGYKGKPTDSMKIFVLNLHAGCSQMHIIPKPGMF